MNHLTRNEWEQIVSLYLDGELDADQTKKLESYLMTHPAAAHEVQLLRTAKRMLAEKQPLPADDWFWLKLSNRLEQGRTRTPSVLASTRPSIALSTFAVLTGIVIGVIFFKDAPLFRDFFLLKKLQVENVYRNNIMTGNILPLFTNLNNDDVLNFALSGSIAIDSSRNTSLQVKNSEDSGSQIQIVRNGVNAAVPVTMNDFADEIGISHNQREVVDSILGSYKERLQASVLVSENDEVAIHSELVELNRAMVSTIAACLEPPQRNRFKRFLDDRKAPYALVALNAPTVPSHIILNKMPRLMQTNNYVVISPDTVEIAEMTINVDSIRDVARRQEMKYRKMMTERMVAELTERQRHLEENFVGMGQNKVRVHSSSGAFQIHFDHRAPSGMQVGGASEMVRPRMTAPEFPRPTFNQVIVEGDSSFTFEIPADDRTVRVFKRLPRGEFRYEIVDSMMREPKMKLMFRSPAARSEYESRIREGNEREEELIDLDSLLRESDKGPAVAPKRPKKDSEVELML